ncbi:MAG: SulP family inorganic anion transporter [Actinomycetota bacterium]|nr:SulP family inorganic anion transporter [Actinomycetota bacterium]
MTSTRPDADAAGDAPTLRERITPYFPILTWLPTYNRGWWSKDAIAGLTLWGLLVPEGMAYAGIAGLPPEAGLYTLVASLLVYGLMGTSRHLSVGPTSATSALLASSVAGIVVIGVVEGESDGQTYQTNAAAFVLVVGLVFLLAGILRLGYITQFLSKPVMDGFVLGIAVYVAVGQLNKIFGVEKTDGNTVEKFFGIIEEIPQGNWTALTIGVASLALLFGLPVINPKIPAGLIVLFGSIIVSSSLDLAGTEGVETVGLLPQGLPSLDFTAVPLRTYFAMVLPAIGVFLVAYSEALGVAREFADKHGYEVDPDQELNAHAATNIVSSFFGGMIAAGGMSGSAVKEGAGARTQLSNLVAWVATILTLLFLTPLFESLPEAVLGALIIHALWHILASRKLRTLRRESKTEFWFGLLALLGVLLVGVLEGMVIGLIASLVYFIYRTSRPYLASLGRIPGAPGAYGDLVRHPEYRAVPGILVLRLFGELYYANALTVRDEIRVRISESETPVRAIILEIGDQDSIDLTTARVLKDWALGLADKELSLYLTDVQDPVLDFLKSVGMSDAVADDHVFPTIELAVRHVESQWQAEGFTPGAASPGTDPAGAGDTEATGP